MEPAFERYLNEIAMPDPFKQRVEKLLTDFAPLYPQPPQQIFVTDLFDAENVRRYQNVWLFSQDFMLEMKNFIASEQIDFMRITNNIHYVEVVKVDFDLKAATQKSRLTFYGTVGSTYGTSTPNYLLQAAANNCTHLLGILRDRFLPNIAA
jgi:hypothetical protein